jgi:hypothetical protein
MTTVNVLPLQAASSKLTSQHLQKKAYVYLRQSTMGQVLHHQESISRLQLVLSRHGQLCFEY